jgi:hypothetical protein
MGGEPSLFNPGDKAPNDGVYIETGEDDFHMGIEDPAQVELKKGQKFPETTNRNRKWTRKDRK